MGNIQEEVLADARGFMKSRAILTAAELGIFTLLHEKPAAAGDVAAALDLDARAAARLLDALVALDLLAKEGGIYRTTSKGELLSSRHPESVLPMVTHYYHLWESWGNLTETIRLGHNPKRKPIAERGAGSLEAFIGAMHVVGRDLSLEIAESIDLSPYRRLLDVGGASGTYVIAFLRKNPEMTAVLFDQKDVIPMAEKRLREEGLRERVDLVAGDFYVDELPAGCDLALLSAIIHQNSPQENIELYRKVYRALPPGGVVLIRDHVMDEERTRPAPGALFALNMLVNTAGGDTYTFSEIKETLEQAGFREVRWIKKGERMDCVVEGRKLGAES